MIPFKLQLMMSLIALTGMAFLLYQIVKYKLELKYSLLWLFLSLATIVLALIPRLSLQIAHWFGIETPANVIFLFGILVSLLIVFSLTVALSQHMMRIRHLTQELGLYKNELARLQEQVNELAVEKNKAGK